MKNTIKKILKEESLKQTLKQQVKVFGWKDTAELVGGTENLIKLGFNNYPMEFLHLFNDLDVVQSVEDEDWTLFRYKKGNNLMVYDGKTEYVYVNYEQIWSFLKDGFSLDLSEIKDIIKIWLRDVYNLMGHRIYGNDEKVIGNIE
jgi:hypothetical protein